LRPEAAVAVQMPLLWPWGGDVLIAAFAGQLWLDDRRFQDRRDYLQMATAVR
jgi:hypothetical protein